MLQLDLGYNPISNLEVVSMINVNSISHGWISYSLASRQKKYNLKVILGSLISTAAWWNYNHDNGSETKLSHWPES